MNNETQNPDYYRYEGTGPRNGEIVKRWQDNTGTWQKKLVIDGTGEGFWGTVTLNPAKIPDDELRELGLID